MAQKKEYATKTQNVKTCKLKKLCMIAQPKSKTNKYAKKKKKMQLLCMYSSVQINGLTTK